MTKPHLRLVQALVFDVFGTVVDWRGSLLAELRDFGASRGLALDWESFVDAWYWGHRAAMDRVRAAELPWTNDDRLHRMILDQLLEKNALAHLGEDDRSRLNRAWHRLEPWADVLPGLERLRRKYVLGTLSNGSVAVLVNMAKRAKLPWDVVLSAELVRRFKPDPKVYELASALLGLEPAQVLLVAAHRYDLAAASAQGFRTAYVFRPLEYGPGVSPERVSRDEFDLWASDFIELAGLLDA